LIYFKIKVLSQNISLHKINFFNFFNSIYIYIYIYHIKSIPKKYLIINISLTNNFNLIIKFLKEYLNKNKL